MVAPGELRHTGVRWGSQTLRGQVERAAVKDEIDRLGPWLHDIEVLPGLRTGAARPAEDAYKDVPQN